MKTNINLNKLLIFTLLLTLILSACSPSAPQAPTSDPNAVVNPVEPTTDMSMLETHVAETVYAEFTQAALLQPSETPLPPTENVVLSPVATNTPYILSTNTSLPLVVPQTVVWVASSTPAKTSTPEDENFRCMILSQTIGYEEVMFPGEAFEAGWRIENKGKAYWNESGIDIVYVSGTKMHTVSSPLDLGQDVPPTGNFSFSISMRAPSSAGYYEANWILQGDPGTFCPLYVRIKVE